MRLTCVALRSRSVDETNQCAVYDVVTATMPRRFRAGAPFIRSTLEEHLKREVSAWLGCQVKVERGNGRALVVVPSVKWPAVAADINAVAGMMPASPPDTLVVASDSTPEAVISKQLPVANKPEWDWIRTACGEAGARVPATHTERDVLAEVGAILTRWRVTGAPRLTFPDPARVQILVPLDTPAVAVVEIMRMAQRRLPAWVAWRVERGV